MSDDATSEKNIAVKVSKAPSAKKKRAPRKKSSGSTASVTRRSIAGTTDEGVNVVTLDTVLVINNANILHSAFAQFLDSNDNEIVIDASSVEMLDTAIAQLIYSFVSTLRSSGKVVTWRSPSEEFTGRIKSLGLASILGI